MRLALALFACALAACAAGIDGHWSAQLARGKKAAEQPPAPFSIDLKTSGATVTGSVALPGKKKPQVQAIENGKLDGGHLTFTTSQKGKNPVSFSWDATLEGDQLAGTRTRDGAKHGQKFTAQRN
jgi:hypothetical protein